MRRAYVEAHCPLPESFDLAHEWAGSNVVVIASSTSAIEASEWLPRSGLPLGVTSHRRSRYTARPAGTVIAWCLGLEDILNVESGVDVDGVVSVRAFDEHRPWVTAHQVEHLGGHQLGPTSEASAAVKATVKGITLLPILNQGLVDSRERSSAIQALTYLRRHGEELDPSQLIVEAIRNGWPRRSPLELSMIAKDLNAGKRLRYESRVSEERLAQWAAGT